MSATPLSGFQFERVLSEDPQTRRVVLLGSAPARAGAGASTATDAAGGRDAVIVTLEKTAFDGEAWANNQHALQHMFARFKQLGQNDIYSWLLGWTADAADAPADVKINVIRPATETHIRKMSAQDTVVIQETPELFQTKVLPWLNAQPASRIQWVYNILEGKTKETVLHNDPDPKTGFVILPDLKWDQTTKSALYMTAIVQDHALRSLRDLRPLKENPQHSELLAKIRDAGRRIASERYGVQAPPGSEAVKCFIHYHPSYYHMHVHIIAAGYIHPTALAGRAHLVDDILDLLSLGVDFAQRTLTHTVAPTSDLGRLLLGPEVQSTSTVRDRSW